MKKRFVFAVVHLIAVLISGSVAAYGQQSYADLLGQKVSPLSNAAFGRYVSNSTAPRVIQFVAKVRF